MRKANRAPQAQAPHDRREPRCRQRRWPRCPGRREPVLGRRSRAATRRASRSPRPRRRRCAWRSTSAAYAAGRRDGLLRLRRAGRADGPGARGRHRGPHARRGGPRPPRATRRRWRSSCPPGTTRRPSACASRRSRTCSPRPRAASGSAPRTSATRAPATSTSPCVQNPSQAFLDTRNVRGEDALHRRRGLAACAPARCSTIRDTAHADPVVLHAPTTASRTTSPPYKHAGADAERSPTTLTTYWFFEAASCNSLTPHRLRDAHRRRHATSTTTSLRTCSSCA